MPRASWYGKRDAVDAETYREWVAKERLRMREYMRLRRAAAIKERAGEPAYPEPVLAWMERWLDDHRKAQAELDLAEVAFYMRKAARDGGCVEFDTIQDRGVAKFLRVRGLRLRRAAGGMVVEGVWIK